MNTSQGEGESPSWTPSNTNSEESPGKLVNYPLSSSESSSVSYDDNHDIIEFGPIKVKPRKKPAPTLATGRRSKYEVLNPDEEQKRDVRRARNRAAAERVRISRLNVEQQLQGQIDTLEVQEQQLTNKVEILKYRKINLEARILTHEKICPTMIELNLHNDFIPVYPANNPTTTTTVFQSTEEVSDVNLDDIFADPLLPLQNQQDTYPDTLTLLPDIDPEDLFINP